MGILRYYLVVLLACSFALPALASVINFQSTHLGGTTWRYDYTVDNAGAGVPIEEWTIYFDRDRYSNLKNIADVPQWDVLALQPDLALSADGIIDGLAKAAGIAPGASQSGFAVTFDYAGNDSPGSQPFEIWDPVSYVLLYAGNTEPLVHAVPLPSTIALLLAAGLAWLISAARLRHTTILRVLGVALSVLVTTSLAQASPQLTISSLQKTGEKRINRTVFEYTFKASVSNTGLVPEKSVTAELTRAGEGTDIISGVIAAGDIAADATVRPAGALVVRHDRTFPFSLASLS